MVRFAFIALLYFIATTAQATDIPSSKRSIQAIERVGEQLKEDFLIGGIAWGSPVFIRIFKEEAVLEMWVRKNDTYRHFRSYAICRYSGDLGPKLKEGDGQAPEGFYTVKARDLNPNSSYHLSFNLGFPNRYDKAKGRNGSFLMVHGDCVSSGCYAMAKRFIPIGSDRNEPIEEIWALMTAAYKKGQRSIPVHAYPFRMTPANMKKYASSKWISFWQELRPAFNFFEQTRKLPDVRIAEDNYIISVVE